MRRSVSVAFALLAAVMITTAQPVAAANTAVASINTTDADFQNGSLTNATVEGVGNSASVKAQIGGVETTRPADDNSGSSSGQFGLQIEPNTDLSGVKLTISSQTSGATTAYLKDSSGTTLDTASITNGAATLSASLTAGSKYNVTVDDSGSSYTVGFYGSPSYPYDGQSLDITAGYQDGNRNLNNAYAITSVAPKFTSETAEYISANHSVSEATTAFTNLTLENASATVTWESHDGSSWQTVDQTTYTTTGNKTVDVSSTADETWRVNVTFENKSGVTTAKLHDEGLLFENRNPEIDTSTVNPSDGERLTKSDTTLKLNITDAEFATAQGEKVTATFKVKEPGETSFDTEGTDTLTANGTAALNFNAADGGEYEWKVEANDDYGGSATSTTRTFETPANITFRNESNASQVVTGANVTVTFYNKDGTTIVTKEDTDDDGNISLDGLPTTEEMVLEIRADGWHRRTVYLESIFEQSDIYLLNKTAYPNPPIITFDYEDRTGEFPGSESTVRVQRAVDKNNNNSSEWETVAADFVNSAGEFTWRGETDVRYRVVVENADNDRRILQHYTPLADATEPLIIGQITWEAPDGQVRFFDAKLDSDAEEIAFTYQDPTENTTEVRIRVVELHNESNEIYDQNFTGGPYGNLTGVVALTANQSNQSWIVKYNAETDADGSINGQTTVGSATVPLPIDEWLLGTFGLIFLTFVGALYGPRTSTLGAWTMLLVAGAFMGFGWVDIHPAWFVVGVGLVVGATLYNEATT